MSGLVQFQLKKQERWNELLKNKNVRKYGLLQNLMPSRRILPLAFGQFQETTMTGLRGTFLIYSLVCRLRRDYLKKFVRKKLCYAIRSSSDTYEDVGNWSIYAGVATEKVSELCRELWENLRRWLKRGYRRRGCSCDKTFENHDSISCGRP